MAEANPRELDLIKIFQSRIVDIQLSPEQTHPQHLLRWIRAREGDISKAEEMLRRHMEWRKTNGIGPSLLDWSPSQYLTDTYRAKFCGFDKSGSPILLFTFGIWDLRPALAKGEKENVIRYKDQSLEKVMKLMKLYEEQRLHHSSILSKTPSKVTQFNCICDWTGFSLRYIMSKEAVEVILEAARSFEANYPETLKAAYNVNCPKVFDVLFKLVKPFLSERTLSKIFIYDNNEARWKLDILSNLPKDQVPVRYGGTRERLWDLHDLNLDLSQDGSFFSEVFSQRDKIAKNSDIENNDNDGYKMIQVIPFDKVSIPVTIASPGTLLKWKFKTENYQNQIDFQILFEGGNQNERNSKVNLENVTKDSGELECDASGNYWIVFNNEDMDECTNVLYKLQLDVIENAE